MQKLFLFSFFALLLVLSACREDEIITTSTTVIPEPKISVNAGVYGLVTDDAGNALADADVRWGTQTTQTDDNGFFRIENAVVDQRNAQLRVEKVGYWTALPGFSVGNAEELNLTVQLRERTLNQSFNAADAAQLDVDGDATVTLPAAYTTADGQAYTGEVNAYATYLDPTDPDLWEVMPGNLRALNAESAPQLLRTFGMVNVELETPTGEPLQIDGTATLRMDVPATLQGDAPNTIPLWYFDETTGLWLEEGEAQLQNGAYVGTVDHFTWWNCDVPQDFIFLEGQIAPDSGDPIYYIRFTVVSNDSYGVLTTDNKGNFAGNVPKEELLFLEILDLCGSVVYEEQIGPFSVDATLPLISFAASTTEQFTVSGTLLDCDNAPVTDGYVRLLGDFGDQYVLPGADGTFSFTGYTCDQNDITISGIDLIAQKASDPVVYAHAPTIDAGTIVACDQDVTSYIRFNDPDGNLVEYTPVIIDLFDNSGQGTLLNLVVSEVGDNGSLTYNFGLLLDTPFGMPYTAVIDSDIIIFGTIDSPFYTVSGSTQYPDGFAPIENVPGAAWELEMTDLVVSNGQTGQSAATDFSLRIVF